MLWIGMVSMAMVFAGLTSGYIVRRAEGNWIVFDLPHEMWNSTIAIVLSSVTMAGALRAAKAHNRSRMLLMLILTLTLGVIFTFFQFLGFGTLIREGIYFTGETANAAGSFLYVIVWTHLMHVAFGFISLLYMMYNGLRGKYDNGNTLGMELGSTFWHFLDGVWVYLFVFLLLVR